MKILVTGTAGFIGFHLKQVLLNRGNQVVGLDIINDYYDVNLKFARLAKTGIAKEEISYGKLVQSTVYNNYRFIQMKLEDADGLMNLAKSENFDVIVNLAAQAGVRYSIENPSAYIQANIVGFANILEAARHSKAKHLVYASSSSVYGLNETMPFSVHHNVDHPISLYAASKKSNELMAHTYSQLYNLPTTGLRFFTVYGPWGRPDMALFLFTKAILADQPIQVFNNGQMRRDFTYIDDIVQGIVGVIDNTAKPNPEWTGKTPDPGTSVAPYKIYNIGNSSPVMLMDFIGEIEHNLGKVATKEMLPLQDGDVPATSSDVSDLMRDCGYKPTTSVKQGVKNFIDWYLDFYK